MRKDSDPKFGFNIENDDTTYVPCGQEKGCNSHNETFWAEQGRFPSSSPNGLTYYEKGADLRVYDI